MACFNVSFARLDQSVEFDFTKVSQSLEVSFSEVCSINEEPNHIVLRTADGKILTTCNKELLEVLT